jgi:Tfp pilus assembly protein PilF
MTLSGQKRRVGFLAVLLIVAIMVVLTAYWPVLSARAQCTDDDQYLSQNRLVQRPSWASAGSFVSEVLEPSTVAGYYQPLAMISLMLDYAVAGRPDNLVPFHRTSLVLHAANTCLVIVLLYLLFGEPMTAALVGMLFGVHPAIAESVPWIAERKTLLATFFALWSLIAYVRYARRSGWLPYVFCLLGYMLALMSKPTVTPLPLLMLLLDFWPLGRLSWRTLLEKVPLLLVCVIFAVITVVSQARTAYVVVPQDQTWTRIPFVFCHNVIFYLWKVIWPVGVSPIYSFPRLLSLSYPMVLVGVIGTCLLIPALIVSLRWTRALLTGWLIFIVAIFPTMGILGFTWTIAANRFLYLPIIGLLLITAWMLSVIRRSAVSTRAATRIGLLAMVVVLILAETTATRRYLGHWRDSESLYRYMVGVTHENGAAHLGLALALLNQNRADEGMWHLEEAMRCSPDDADVQYNMGRAMYDAGRTSLAQEYFERAVKLRPGFTAAHLNLGTLFYRAGRIDEAIEQCRMAVAAQPNHPQARSNLGIALMGAGRGDEAIEQFNRSLEFEPVNPYAHYSLAVLLGERGDLNEAITHCRRAIELMPGFDDAHRMLDDLLQKRRQVHP